MAVGEQQKSVGERLRDRLFRRPARRFRYELDRLGRTLMVRIDTTNRCNMRCVMCPYSTLGQADKPAQFMEPDLFRRIADQILPYTYHLSLSCAYEPLVHKRFGEILEFAARADVPEWGFVTNALLLDDELAETLVRLRMTVLSVSIDGATCETFRSVRGLDVFDRVLANVRLFQERKRAAGSELPHLFMNYVLMRRTVDEVVPFLELSRELRATDVTFVHVMPRSPENAESLIHEPERYEAVYREAKSLADSLPMRVLLPAPFRADELESAGRPNRERRLQPMRSEDLQSAGAQATSERVEAAGDDIFCASPWMMLFISPNGDVHPCSHRQNDPPFGNLATTPFEEIWNGPAFLELRRRLYYHDLEGICLSCEAQTPNSEPLVRRPIRIL